MEKRFITRWKIESIPITTVRRAANRIGQLLSGQLGKVSELKEPRLRVKSSSPSISITRCLFFCANDYCFTNWTIIFLLSRVEILRRKTFASAGKTKTRKTIFSWMFTSEIALCLREPRMQLDSIELWRFLFAFVIYKLPKNPLSKSQEWTTPVRSLIVNWNTDERAGALPSAWLDDLMEPAECAEWRQSNVKIGVWIIEQSKAKMK